MVVQTYSDGKYIYSVDLMFMYINNRNIISDKIRMQKLSNQLKHKVWSDNIAPIEVIKDKNVSIQDHNRIQSADLRYPIIIDGRIDRSHNFNIVDGMHRLSKAFALNKKYIRAYIFDADLMEKFIISKRYVDSLTKKNIEKLYIRRFLEDATIKNIKIKNYKDMI